MKPDIARFLDVAAAHLMMRTAPGMAATYEQSEVTMLAVMLLAVREEFDRAASRRVEENRALRALFAAAIEAVEDDALRNRLVAAAAQGDADFGIAALEGDNARLRGLLIELHAHVEELATPAARRVEKAIWRELVTSTERRHLSLQAF